MFYILTLSYNKLRYSIPFCVYLCKKSFRSRKTIKYKYVKEFFGEVIGTFVLITFTQGSNAQYKFFKQDDIGQNNLLSPYFASGLAVTAAIITVGKISGSQIFQLKNLRIKQILLT